MKAMETRYEVPLTRMGRTLPMVLMMCTGALATIGCETRDESWFVGDVGFTEAEIERKGVEGRDALADMVALGSDLAAGEVSELLDPVVEAEGKVALSRLLGYALVGEELGYETFRSWYTMGPEWELTVQHLVRLVDESAPAEVADSARQLVEAARRRAEEGEDFGVLAAGYSEEPGAAAREGQIEPGRRGSWVEPFWEAAVRLEPGEVSDVVRTEYGFHLIRLIDREPVPFEDVPRIVVLRSAIPSAQAQAALRDWAEEGEASLRLDEGAARAAIEGWREGRPPRGDTIAAWPRGAMTDRELAARLAGLERAPASRFIEEDPAALVSRLRDFARASMYADEAGRRGVELPSDQEGEIARRWQSRAARWRGVLGVELGGDRSEVREAALEAARSTRQEVRILREELRRLRPFLRERHPVSESSSGSSSSERVTSERNL